MPRLEVVCHCSSYDFPHRLTGGTCNGDEWAEFVFLYIRCDCDMCNCNVDGECQVANGQEDIECCETYQDHLNYSGGLRYPQTIEEMMENLLNE
jgi:hypothetical protein